MTDKPLDCIGLPLTDQVGKNDFRLATTNTVASPASQAEDAQAVRALLENALLNYKYSNVPDQAGISLESLRKLPDATMA